MSADDPFSAINDAIRHAHTHLGFRRDQLMVSMSADTNDQLVRHCDFALHLRDAKGGALSVLGLSFQIDPRMPRGAVNVMLKDTARVVSGVYLASKEEKP